MLRDQLACGVRDSRIQKKLLAESTLDFKKVFEIAQAVETAEHQVKELHDSSIKPVAGREIHRVVKEKKPVNTEEMDMEEMNKRRLSHNALTFDA